MPRLKKPRLDVIKGLCAKKKWGIKELARRAELKQSTVSSVFAGKECLRCTIEAIADALGVRYGELLPPDDSEALDILPESKYGGEELPDDSPLLTVTLHVKQLKKALSDPEIAHIFVGIMKVLDLYDDREPVRVVQRSLHITFNISAKQVHKLLSLYQINMFGKIAGIELRYVTIHGFSSFEEIEAVSRPIADLLRRIVFHVEFNLGDCDVRALTEREIHEQPLAPV